jgi:hypothetical protein
LVGRFNRSWTGIPPNQDAIRSTFHHDEETIMHNGQYKKPYALPLALTFEELAAQDHPGERDISSWHYGMPAGPRTQPNFLVRASGTVTDVFDDVEVHMKRGSRVAIPLRSRVLITAALLTGFIALILLS